MFFDIIELRRKLFKLPHSNYSVSTKSVIAPCIVHVVYEIGIYQMHIHVHVTR